MADYELADFSPDGHLLATCDPLYDGYRCVGNGERMPDSLDCAAILYGIAQDAERALAAVRTLAATWDTLAKGEHPTTRAIRAALGDHDG